MSLILEALKKSEAERRLGQAPDLMTPMPTRRARPRGASILIATGLVAALIAGGAWWLRDRLAPTPAPSGTEASAMPAPAVAAPIAGTVAEEPLVEPMRPTAAAASTEGSGAAAAERRRTSEPIGTPLVTPTPAVPQFDSVERESIPSPAAAPEAPTAPSTPISQTALAEPPSPPGVDPATAPSLPTPTEAASNLPRLDQLSSSERDALPPLKLSMHVYAPSPTGRFVLVDGRRYREGEKLATSLQVLEIRREGVVLDFNGRQFLLLRQ